MEAYNWERVAEIAGWKTTEKKLSGDNYEQQQAMFARLEESGERTSPRPGKEKPEEPKLDKPAEVTTPFQEAWFLEKQHPYSYIQGVWYPAKLPNGKDVRIKRSSGVGKNRKSTWIHVEMDVPIHLYNEGNPTPVKTRMGKRRLRIKLGDPNARWEEYSSG